MPNDDGEQMHEDKILNSKADHRQRQVFDAPIDDILHEVIPQMRGKTHLRDGVVYFMEFPEPRYIVQQSVRVPLDKITDQKQSQQLGPMRPGSQVESHEVADTKNRSQKVVESLNGHTRNSGIPDEREKEEIEKHVEPVQPEITAQGGLVFSPWEKQFERVHRQ